MTFIIEGLKYKIKEIGMTNHTWVFVSHERYD